MPRLPRVYVPPPIDAEEAVEGDRVKAPTVAADSRRRSFEEVELSFSVEEATCEARRCLRCDLEFTEPREDALPSAAVEGGAAW